MVPNISNTPDASSEACRPNFLSVNSNHLGPSGFPSDIVSSLAEAQVKAKNNRKQVETKLQGYGSCIAVAYPSGLVTFYSRSKKGPRQKLGSLGEINFLGLISKLAKLSEVNSDGAQTSDLTVSELFDRFYRPAIEGRRSARDTIARFNKWVRRQIGHLKLNELTALKLHSIQSQEGISALKNATWNRIRAVVVSLFNWAVSSGLMSNNPASFLRILPENNIRVQHLTGESLDKFLAAVDAEPDTKISAIILLLCLLGVRTGELLNSQWSDVDWDAQTLLLSGSRTKNGMPRYVHLPESAVSILKTIQPVAHNPYIFASSKTAGPMGFPRRAFERVKRLAGIYDLRPHDLRRTFASISLNAGVPLSTVSKQLGHSSTGVTEARYAFLCADNLRKAGKIVSDVLMAASPSSKIARKAHAGGGAL